MIQQILADNAIPYTIDANVIKFKNILIARFYTFAILYLLAIMVEDVSIIIGC